MSRSFRWLVVAGVLGLSLTPLAEAQRSPRVPVAPRVRVEPRLRVDRGQKAELRFRALERARERIESARVRQFAARGLALRQGIKARERAMQVRERAMIRLRDRALMVRRPLLWRRFRTI